MVVVIILLIILISIGGVLIYQNYQNKNDSSKDVGTSDKIDNNNVGSENNNQEPVVKTLSDKVIGIFTNDMTSPYEDYYFKRDKIIMADEPISMRLAISSYHLGKMFGTMTPDGVETILKEEDVKNEYEKLFGKNSYKISQFETNCGKEFSYSNGYYTSVSPDGCGGTSASYSVSELAYAKEIVDGNKSTIEIYEYYYYEYTYDAIKGTGDVKFYSDYMQTI